jgi:hypothetical protein
MTCLDSSLRSAMFIVLGAVAGCGGPARYPVQGSIRLADGMSLAGGGVEFAAKEGIHMATAVIQEDGSYALSSTGKLDGAPPGAYRIRVLPPDSEAEEPEDDNGNIIGVGAERPLVPYQYQDFDTSGLEYVVKEDGENTFDIVLQR